MRRDELSIAINWARGEGWNPGIYDADSFFAADSGGFLIGELDGEPVATISAVRYAPAFGFIGLYIVKPEHRGRGFGLAIWREACRRLAGRVVGLDGVVARQHDYRKSGFESAYRHIRFKGTVVPKIGGGARELFPADLGQVAALDRMFFGAEREGFLRAFCFPPNGRTFGVERGGGLSAYGTIRSCFDGWKIGPLFAPDAEAAGVLASELIRAGSAGNFYWDVPEPNAPAIKLAEDHFGMTPMFETARMYNGGSWELPVSSIWGTSTLELG